MTHAVSVHSNARIPQSFVWTNTIREGTRHEAGVASSANQDNSGGFVFAYFAYFVVKKREASAMGEKIVFKEDSYRIIEAC